MVDPNDQFNQDMSRFQVQPKEVPAAQAVTPAGSAGPLQRSSAATAGRWAKDIGMPAPKQPQAGVQGNQPPISNANASVGGGQYDEWSYNGGKPAAGVKTYRDTEQIPAADAKPMAGTVTAPAQKQSGFMLPKEAMSAGPIAGYNPDGSAYTNGPSAAARYPGFSPRERLAMAKANGEDRNRARDEAEYDRKNSTMRMATPEQLERIRSMNPPEAPLQSQSITASVPRRSAASPGVYNNNSLVKYGNTGPSTTVPPQMKPTMRTAPAPMTGYTGAQKVAGPPVGGMKTPVSPFEKRMLSVGSL
jgi:hypothetical protein